MSSASPYSRFHWTTVAPVAATVVLVLARGRHPGTVMALGIGIFLVGAVLSAVHHAEVVAPGSASPSARCCSRPP